MYYVYLAFNQICCTPTDDKPATHPPTRPPTTHAPTTRRPTKPPTTHAPTTHRPTKPPTTEAPTEPRKTIILSFYYLFIIHLILEMSVKVGFEFGRYTVKESCTLLSVTLVVKGEVIRPFIVGVYPTGFYVPSAIGMCKSP